MPISDTEKGSPTKAFDELSGYGLATSIVKKTVDYSTLFKQSAVEISKGLNRQNKT